jgi:hypothetical protein
MNAEHREAIKRTSSELVQSGRRTCQRCLAVVDDSRRRIAASKERIASAFDDPAVVHPAPTDLRRRE